MSFIFPRTITITRPAVQAGVGEIGYGGQTRTTETAVAANVPASIQLKREGARPTTDLPGDISKRTFWVVIFSLAAGTVNDRDIITDDLGVRYQVFAPYWNSLGYQCLCERLEV